MTPKEKEKVIKKYNDMWAQVENIPVKRYVINCPYCYSRDRINVNSFKIFSKIGKGIADKNWYYVCNKCKKVFMREGV